MIYKQLGNTGKEISVIGFGGMRFKKSEYQDGNLDKCAEIILRAQELGVNYFDTAPGYCDDTSEPIFGHAFKQMKKLPYVSTKCGLWLATDADGARRKIESSLKRLNLEKIDFYNMWCIMKLEQYRQMTAKGGIYDGILKAKEEGLIGHICCSTHLDGNGIEQIVKDGRVDVVTLGYNALNFAYRRTGVKACHDAGVGVVVMNPLGGGVITRHEERFGFIKSSPDQPIAIAALRFLIGQPEIGVALPGISSIAEIEQCVKAAEHIEPVGQDALDLMKQSLTEKLDSLCTGCGYCDECPEGVPIPKLLDSFNEGILSENMAKVSERLSMHWGITSSEASACTACGHCETLCTQKLPIIERLKQISEA